MKLGVVGRGLVGAAAARHLASGGHDVTLIGPAEPNNRATHEGVFGSHYDEGRITRLLDPHPVWEDLAAQSIARYGEIEAASGIGFYNPKGVLMGAPKGATYLDQLRQVRDAAGVEAREFSGADLPDAFPYLAFDADYVMLHQATQAGHISPRRLVAAQSEAARRAGAKLVDAYATHVRGGTVQSSAGAFTFDHVLVACGAFTNMVLDRPLAFKVLARTIALLRISAAEAARLHAMPSIIYRVADGSGPYVLPPIRYPDGHIYLKIGGEPDDVILRDADATKAWFRTAGNPDVGDYLIARMKTLLPGLQYEAAHTQACAVTYTQTGLPYVGAIDARTFVAAGGCGAAAKSSDEIGRIAAGALLGQNDARFDVVFEGGLA